MLYGAAAAATTTAMFTTTTTTTTLSTVSTTTTVCRVALFYNYYSVVVGVFCRLPTVMHRIWTG